MTLWKGYTFLISKRSGDQARFEAKADVGPLSHTALCQSRRERWSPSLVLPASGGRIRLIWEAYTPRDPGDEGSLGVTRVLHSIWRGRIGEPKNLSLEGSGSTHPPNLRPCSNGNGKRMETQTPDRSLRMAPGRRSISIACIAPDARTPQPGRL